MFTPFGALESRKAPGFGQLVCWMSQQWSRTANTLFLSKGAHARDLTLLLPCHLQGAPPPPLRGQEVSGPALHPKVGMWGTLINSHVHLIKITLHPNASFVRTVIGPAERSRGEAERKGRLEWHSDI